MEENKELSLIISEIELPKITITNKDEIIAGLKECLVLYDRVLTEETLQDGKKDKAKLNKLVEAIEDKRKEIKKLVAIPYTEIEIEFKEITNLISEASDKLDKQVKVFEKKEKEIKNTKINELIEKYDTENIITSKINWLNATYKLKDIEEEIKSEVSKYNQDIEILKDEDIYIKDYYKKCRDISATLIEKKRLADLKEQEEKKKELEITEVTVDTSHEVEEVVKVTEEIELKNTITLELEVNRLEAIKLKEFLTQNSIKYTVIK